MTSLLVVVTRGCGYDITVGVMCSQKLSLDGSKASDPRRSVSEHSAKSPFSSQSPATHENSNVVIYEVGRAPDWLAALMI